MGDVERLASALDGIDLNDKDRATLHAVFALAGQAAGGESESEVSGFLLPAIRGGLGSFQGSDGGDCFGSFKRGIDWSGPGDDVQPIDY